MRRWQKRLSQHHQIEVLNEYTVKICNIGYSKDAWYDEIITKLHPEYQVDTYVNGTTILVDSHLERSIRNYLGY